MSGADSGIGAGFVPTPMTESAHRARAWQEARLASIPLGRFGEPRDIAGPTVFPASNAAAYVTG